MCVPGGIDARGFRTAASPAGPCPGRLRRGGGRAAGATREDCLLLPDPASFQRLVREGLSPGDYGAFLDGHVSAFAFLGGVPRSILYDNTTLAVARILGDGTRRRTQAFSRATEDVRTPASCGACRPPSKNDQGIQECEVAVLYHSVANRGCRMTLAGARATKSKEGGSCKPAAARAPHDGSTSLTWSPARNRRAHCERAFPARRRRPRSVRP